MKYTVEITKDNMIHKFTDDNGNEYINTWHVVGPGHTQTKEKALDDQMEEAGINNYNLLQAVYDCDLQDIWEAIRRGE